VKTILLTALLLDAAQAEVTPDAFWLDDLGTRFVGRSHPTARRESLADVALSHARWRDLVSETAESAHSAIAFAIRVARQSQLRASLEDPVGRACLPRLRPTSPPSLYRPATDPRPNFWHNSNAACVLNQPTRTGIQTTMVTGAETIEFGYRVTARGTRSDESLLDA
jgi:hypothetical protein